MQKKKKNYEKIIKRHKNIASQFNHNYIIYKILVLIKIIRILKPFLRSITDFYFLKNN